MLDIDGYDSIDVPSYILFTMDTNGVAIQKLKGVGKNDA